MRETRRDPVVLALFGEIVMVETLARSRRARILPKGMELSHFMVLDHFARLGGEKTPAQLARIFHVTEGAAGDRAILAISPAFDPDRERNEGPGLRGAPPLA